MGNRPQALLVVMMILLLIAVGLFNYGRTNVHRPDCETLFDYNNQWTVVRCRE